MNDTTPPGLHGTSPSLVHRFNNFLTLCMTHTEVALDSRDPEEMATALQWILDGARDMAPERDNQVQHQLPYDQRQEAVRHG